MMNFYFQDMCPSVKDLVEDQRGCPQCSVIYACKAFGTEEGKMIKNGKLEDIEKVAILERELHHVGEGTEEVSRISRCICY